LDQVAQILNSDFFALFETHEFLYFLVDAHKDSLHCVVADSEVIPQLKQVLLHEGLAVLELDQLLRNWLVNRLFKFVDVLHLSLLTLIPDRPDIGVLIFYFEVLRLFPIVDNLLNDAGSLLHVLAQQNTKPVILFAHVNAYK